MLPGKNTKKTLFLYQPFSIIIIVLATIGATCCWLSFSTRFPVREGWLMTQFLCHLLGQWPMVIRCLSCAVITESVPIPQKIGLAFRVFHCTQVKNCQIPKQAIFIYYYFVWNVKVVWSKCQKDRSSGREGSKNWMLARKFYVEMFYLNSKLNFGILPVLLFQLEVYFKLDRLLTAQLKGTPARWYSNKTSLISLNVRQTKWEHFCGVSPLYLVSVLHFYTCAIESFTPNPYNWDSWQLFISTFVMKVTLFIHRSPIVVTNSLVTCHSLLTKASLSLVRSMNL